MNTDTLNKSIIRKINANIGGDDKAGIPHPVKWTWSFPCNTPEEADTFLLARAYYYAARESLHEDAVAGLYTKDSPAPTLAELRVFAHEAVTSPNEKRGGGNGGGNPALAAKATAFASFVKQGILKREEVLPQLATGKATMEQAALALDKAIAKLPA